jgi:hypothetical protein
LEAVRLALAELGDAPNQEVTASVGTGLGGAPGLALGLRQAFTAG